MPSTATLFKITEEGGSRDQKSTGDACSTQCRGDPAACDRATCSRNTIEPGADKAAGSDAIAPRRIETMRVPTVCLMFECVRGVSRVKKDDDADYFRSADQCTEPVQEFVTDPCGDTPHPLEKAHGAGFDGS